jgi:phosphoribosylamine-glycine ligase
MDDQEARAGSAPTGRELIFKKQIEDQFRAAGIKVTEQERHAAILEQKFQFRKETRKHRRRKSLIDLRLQDWSKMIYQRTCIIG